MDKKTNIATDAESAQQNETSEGRLTPTQDTGPKNQDESRVRGDDYSDEPSRLEGLDVADANKEFEGEEE